MPRGSTSPPPKGEPLSQRATNAAGVLLATLVAGPLEAQAPGIDVLYGRWWGDSGTSVYSAAYVRPALGPISYGLGVIHIDDRLSPLNRTQTGGELTVGLGRQGSGPYSIGAVSLAMRHDDGSLDAHWSVGLGYAFRAVSAVSLGIEAAYRVEDSRAQGFWRLDPSDRRGVVLQGRLMVRLGSGGERAGRPRGGAGVLPTSMAGSEARAGRRLRMPDGAATAARVVEIALAAMGTPYQWGGSDANGYDCSGLIQFAYGEHGILLPRVSRDQARLGTAVDLAVGGLAPGDILGFALEGTRVSHVGLYVGGGDFIHSTSTGVRLSSLSATDPDSQWWQTRWVSARRLLE